MVGKLALTHETQFSCIHTFISDSNIMHKQKKDVQSILATGFPSLW